MKQTNNFLINKLSILNQKESFAAKNQAIYAKLSSPKELGGKYGERGCVTRNLPEVAAFFPFLSFLVEAQNLVDYLDVGEQHSPATVPFNA
jgi:hypothetical protein